MVHSFSNFRVGTKILIGYVIALLLMAAVIVMALLRMGTINNTVAELARGLAAEQHMADQMVADVWATHYFALQYMDQQNPADLARYRAEYDSFNRLLADADQSIWKEERIGYLDTIRDGIQAYGQDVDHVVNLLNRRNRELLVTLDKQGRLADIKLEQIRAKSFFSEDADASYQAGNVQRELLLMRVAAFQYLESGDPYWVEEFNRSYDNAQTGFRKLDETRLTPVYGTMAEDAEAAVRTYAQSFTEIQENYSEQEWIVTQRLNVVGPEIRQAGAAISQNVAADFQSAASATQSLASQTQNLLLLTMGLAIVAALGSGYIITRSITRPLDQVTAVARQIADLDLRQLTSEMGAVGQGDLTRHLTITTRAISIRSGDEIGQMARAFNAIVRQVQQAGRAFSDMASNLRTLTERNAQLFAQAQTDRRNAEAASAAKSNFLASMSHELRTPLNAILGYAQILQRDNQLPPMHLEGLAVIEESGQHLLTLINDLLDLARIETGKLWLEPNTVYLPAFLDNVVSMMALRARQKGLQFEEQRGAQLPTGVEVDEKRLRQVLINLLGNAINFTPAGKVSLQTRVVGGGSRSEADNGSRTGSRRIRFIIADTGIGIEAEQFERIFQPFEQINAGDSGNGGTGLGLAISQEIIKAMGSEICIESEPGTGSTLWFDLSLPVIEVAPAAADQEPPRIAGYAPPGRTILIVDDKQHNRTLLRQFLEPLGFQIVAVDNGEAAVAEAIAHNPDLIILDSAMPGKSGAETLREIRGHPRIGETIVVGTSAGIEHAVLEANGYDAVLTKPISLDYLVELLGNQLGVTWIVESNGQPDHGPPPPAAGSKNGDLVLPPHETLDELYGLAMKGNMPGITRRVSDLAALDPDLTAFTARLSTLTTAYDEEGVLTFLENLLTAKR